MNDIASIVDAHDQAKIAGALRRALVRARSWRLWSVPVIALTLLVAVFPAMTAEAAVSAPRISGPSNRSATTISVVIFRTPDSGMICQLDYGYEVRAGLGAAWRDVGGFPNAPCDDPDPGYKFSGLTPSTTYVLSVRAYHIVGGVKDYSPEASLSASTLEGTTPPPTTTTTTTTTLPGTPTTTRRDHDDAARSDGSEPAAHQRADQPHRDDDQRAPVPHAGLGHGLPAQLRLRGPRGWVPPGSTSAASRATAPTRRPGTSSPG